jgi:hypothetical protein
MSAKTIKIAEAKTVNFKLTRGMLNKPTGRAQLDINSASFGQINATGVTGTPDFQAQMRFSF